MILGRYKITLLNVIFVLLYTATFVMCVKREDFKTCSQSGFCSRQRAFAELQDTIGAASPESNYEVVPDSFKYNKSNGEIKLEVKNTKEDVILNVEFILLQSGSVRVKMEEKDDPLEKKRFDPSSYSLGNDDPPRVDDFEVVELTPNRILYKFGKKKLMKTTFVIQLIPFKFDVSKDNDIILLFNDYNYFNYEHHRTKPVVEETTSTVKEEETTTSVSEENNEDVTDVSEENKEETTDGVIANKVDEENEKKIAELREKVKKDMWGEEKFKQSTDSRPYGPESIGFDISFPLTQHIYGLPQHSGPLNLRSTRTRYSNDKKGDEYSEPYRLYNLDVFEYEVDNPMALYGSIPFIMAQREDHTMGILFVNSSEMWVDITRNEIATTTHWMAESGKLDFILFVANSPKDLMKKYMSVVGKPPLPQSFSLAYHQSRWNYIDENDVATLDENFDKYNIPMDVVWLDIEHTDGKRYFTWDPAKFPHPEEMQKKLAVKGRKMVAIVDPHIKVDDDYYIYKQAKDLDYLVHDKTDEQFIGWCWPGNSAWIDYFNSAASKWLSDQFKLENYKGSTKDLYTWIDMNEPSVFSGPEVTMPKDNLHFGKIEHRDVHNVYGELYQEVAYKGLIQKGDNQNRPFILSRAFFIGSQRYGAIWTGDNDSTWTHLQASIPMTLSIGVAGLTFSGADVGGFFNNPDAELFVRWYQAAAFQPFFRGHSHIDSKRREPWLYDDETMDNIREAIKIRYSLLPYWYTLFWEASVNGLPTMRPVFLEFPQRTKTYEMNDQFMVGEALMVKPVVNQGQKDISIFFPYPAVWYNYFTHEIIKTDSDSLYKMETPMNVIPVFQRGGTIIPQRLRVRRSSQLMKHDPFTLLVALNEDDEAKGKLYVDDGESFQYKQGNYIARQYVYKNDVLLSKKFEFALPAEYGNKTDVLSETTDKSVLVSLSQRIERVVIVGCRENVISVSLTRTSGQVEELSFTLEKAKDGNTNVLTIKDPAVQIKDTDWSIQINY